MSQLNSILNFFVILAVVSAFYMFAAIPKPLPNDTAFTARIESADIVLVKFGANWCGPCRKLEAELDRLAKTSPDVSVIKLDVDQERTLAAYYGVSTIPHVILFRHGQQVGQFKGYRSYEQLQVWIESTK